MEVHGVLVSPAESLSDPAYDGVLLVTYPPELLGPPRALADVVAEAVKIDQSLDKNTAVLRCPNVSGGRLIISPTGPITPYHDVRSVGEAAKRCMERALKAGVRKPLLILQAPSFWTDSELVLLLEAINALYVPLQLRELAPEKKQKAVSLGVFGQSTQRSVKDLIRDAVSIEVARGVARDIAGGDPERMTPGRVADYAQAAFRDTCVRVDVVGGHEALRAAYPLLAAVDRAANAVPRHTGRVIKLEYTGTGKVEQTVMLVGKGVTYDTGGMDVKHGGAMAGMSRDKCGAAAVIGFFKACALLKPAHLKVVGSVGMVRNSIGEEGYVADELVVSRSGLRVRIGNTDAEGRMVMGDLLFEMMERAKKETAPHVYTIATLTGHAVRTVGPGYSIVMDNHVARTTNHSERLVKSGDSIGDMFEVSTIRREDIAAHRGRGEGDDVWQSESKPSTAVCRGHQGPAGFLLLVSRLHEEDVAYSHLDIAGSAGDLPDQPTGAPLVALAKMYRVI